ncbi:putative Chorismate lyase [Rhodovastum atsumiense]|uniref:Translation initiation inhibitor n=1 Tax=Rhodovastum atsumiense TaxID=504468 RepID=A0A5M6IJU5_9PROT|nr:hypothetical protein [Rhodovastum atsumiense]KAA5608452.1 hypothetical protein F1189_29045 [Rhodovastum atsumiense]CAH2604639.1 putative Chorismate lyase [Rhodovastum atsumiense]
MHGCVGARTASRSFTGSSGGTEHVIIVEALPGPDFAEQLEAVARAYAEMQRRLELDAATAVFRRLHVSDVMNQAVQLRASPLCDDPASGPVAVSVVQQPPLPGSKLALLAYHVAAPGMAKRRISPRHLLVGKAELGHLWSTGLCVGEAPPPADATAQTRAAFDELVGTLAGQGGTLAENAVRTWIYVKDVDVLYQDMVDTRTPLLARHGLTTETHYIAATGIEGACGGRHDVIAMDAYSVLGLVPGQVTYLNDFSRLCPTKDYDVTFERGTRVGYADRAHHFISGTASIDHLGRVVHPGDVIRQLDRTLGNVEALLQSGAASLEDLMYLLVYLRDPTDSDRVQWHLRARLPHLPILMVQGPVCRPEWLVEVEGIAITAQSQPFLPDF